MQTTNAQNPVPLDLDGTIENHILTTLDSTASNGMASNGGHRLHVGVQLTDPAGPVPAVFRLYVQSTPTSPFAGPVKEEALSLTANPPTKFEADFTGYAIDVTIQTDNIDVSVRVDAIIQAP